MKSRNLTMMHWIKTLGIMDEDPNMNKELKKIEDEVTDKIDNDIMIDKYKDQFEDEAKIVRPWEELQIQRNRYGLGYEKD